jgi:hypothetical protein
VVNIVSVLCHIPFFTIAACTISTASSKAACVRVRVRVRVGVRVRV